MCEIKYSAKNSTPETSKGTSSVFQMTTVTLRFGTCFTFIERKEKTISNNAVQRKHFIAV